MPDTLRAQDSTFQATATAVTAVTTTTAVKLAGYETIYLELVEGGVGAATVSPQGSFDGVNWYNVGFQAVDNNATPARSVTAIALAQSGAHVYQILDKYQQYRLNITANAGSVTGKFYAIPV